MALPQDCNKKQLNKKNGGCASVTHKINNKMKTLLILISALSLSLLSFMDHYIMTGIALLSFTFIYFIKSIKPC